MAFIPYYRHLMELLETNEELKKTFTGTLKMTGFAAGGTAIGSFFWGKIGGAVGAALGGIVGCLMLDDYESMLDVLRKLKNEDRRRLVERVQRQVGGIAEEALLNYIRNRGQRENLLAVIWDFAKGVTRG